MTTFIHSKKRILRLFSIGWSNSTWQRVYWKHMHPPAGSHKRSNAGVWA